MPLLSFLSDSEGNYQLMELDDTPVVGALTLPYVDSYWTYTSIPDCGGYYYRPNEIFISEDSKINTVSSNHELFADKTSCEEHDVPDDKDNTKVQLSSHVTTNTYSKEDVFYLITSLLAQIIHDSSLIKNTKKEYTLHHNDSLGFSEQGLYLNPEPTLKYLRTKAMILYEIEIPTWQKLEQFWASRDILRCTKEKTGYRYRYKKDVGLKTRLPMWEIRMSSLEQFLKTSSLVTKHDRKE